MDNIEHFHYFSFFSFFVYKVIAVLAIIIMAFFIFIYPFYCWFNSWLTAFASTKACKIIFTMFIIFLHSFFIVHLVLLQLLVRSLIPQRLLLRFLSSCLFPPFVCLACLHLYCIGRHLFVLSLSIT